MLFTQATSLTPMVLPSASVVSSVRNGHDVLVARDPIPRDSREAVSMAALRDAVVEFEPVTSREIRSRDRFLLELDRLPHPFNQDADPVHVTGSAIVIGTRGTVLHRHKRLGIWLQPGGHINPDEEPWEAAARETREETGLAVVHIADSPYLVHLDVHSAGEHFHLDLRYLLVSSDADPAPPPGESQEVSWFSWKAALAVADEALIDGLTRAAAFSGLGLKHSEG